ncbi:MAG: DegT/DnrJ/EryC1/StrS family aminotransferase [Spirochaetes bacterium]|nr:DegT/DnrJ/EryC1/StrS family aminotransferase [Spirochaetota bacterium]
MIKLVDLDKQYEKIKKEINEKITEVLNSKQFIKGKYLKEFEDSFAEAIGDKYCTGCSNGTSALFTSLKALDIKEGDEVITVPNTFIATAEAICHVNAVPVFADINEKTYNIDIDNIEKHITKRTRAIIPVHLYGNPLDMNKLMEIAKIYKLKVIEDCAQSHLASINGKFTGTFGDINAFSFFPGKNLGAYGDAGAIITNSQVLYEKTKMLVDHGRKDKYIHEMIGYNNRMDALQAAVLTVKLKHLKEWTQMRIKNAETYNKYLKDNPKIIIPCTEPGFIHVYHLYVVRLPSRDKVMNKLKENGIECSIHYPVPLHLQPALRFLKYKQNDFPICEKISAEIISLPMYPELTEDEIKFVCDIINNEVI